MKQECELFVINDEQGPIVYSPLNRAAARVNDAAVRSVSRYLYGEPLNEDDVPVIDMLKEHHLFDAAKRPESPTGFAPVQVTLFPTDGCNLRCRYCYANAGKAANKLNPAVGRAAIDLIAKNAVEQGRDGFVLGFHGNGEPFMAFDVMRELCEYAQDKAEKLNTKVFINSATNGVLDDEKLDFVLANFSHINVSFDGLPELQNRQRPFPNGRGSFDAVDSVLKRLDAAGMGYGIRATLTSESVQRLEEIALFVSERYPNCELLHFEPAWECGRCLTTGEHTPDADAFIDQYISALDKLPDNGMRLVFSGARQEAISDSFCAASHGGFTVTSKGYVTACFEVCDTTDPRHERFFYGYYDNERGEFIFDQQKLDALSRLRVENMPYCADCFCKWHCAGDCAAKVLGLKQPEEHGGSTRCKLARALTLDQIQRLLNTQPEEESHE